MKKNRWWEAVVYVWVVTDIRSEDMAFMLSAEKAKKEPAM